MISRNKGYATNAFFVRKILHNLILFLKHNYFAVYNLYILYFCVFIVLVYIFIVYTLILCVTPLFLSLPRHDTNLRPVSLDSVWPGGVLSKKIFEKKWSVTELAKKVTLPMLLLWEKSCVICFHIWNSIISHVLKIITTNVGFCYLTAPPVLFL